MHLANYIIARIRPVFENRVYTVRRGIALGLKRKGGLGFIPQFSEPDEEEKFIKELELTGKTIYDIGGWEGVFSMFFSRKTGSSGKVFAFEPNPKNYNRILENAALNNFKNITVFNLGLGKKKYRSKLIFDNEFTGMGNLENSFNSNSTVKKSLSIDVEVDSLDNIISGKKIPAPDFVKIDVEGLELDVLEGMKKIIKKKKPSLFIEIHGIDVVAKSENIKQVFRFLDSFGYKILHIESGSVLNSKNYTIAVTGHIYCS